VRPFEAQLFTDGRALTWTTQDIEDAELDQLRLLLAEGYSYRDIAHEMGITLSKVQRLKKRLDASEGRISSSTVISSFIGEEAEQ
jgi:transposase